MFARPDPSADEARPAGRHRLSRSDLSALAVTAIVALIFVLGVLVRRAGRGEGNPSLDIYGYSLPIFRTAQDAVARGHGLLWNELQNCGQPFLGIPSTALLYPLNLLLLPLDPTNWLVVQAVLHLAVAGAGAYLLGRELQLSRAACLGVALSFQLGRNPAHQ